MMGAPPRLAMTSARIRLLTLVAVLLAALGATAPASAATCADRIIDDWADNAEIDAHLAAIDAGTLDPTLAPLISSW